MGSKARPGSAIGKAVGSAVGSAPAPATTTSGMNPMSTIKKHLKRLKEMAIPKMGGV